MAAKDKKGSILPVDISGEMKCSYITYAMSVIVARALPDVRDGLKPSHRRILYAMHEAGLTGSAKFKKSATVVGEVLGKYHPHGDSSVYEAMVGLAQDFTSRYPLVHGQGNFGSMDGDPPAAYRYTEAKMSKIAVELLRDIDKETVDFVPNFDGTRSEPTVLPTTVPTLLLNGTLGIAVGMATKVPPHNLSEIMDALIHMTTNKDTSTEDLLKYVQGPDFPTGGIIFNKKDIHHAYSSGRGGVLLRGEAEIVEARNGSYQILVTSIPYKVNKAELQIRIAGLVKDKKIEGIKDIRDESTTLEDTRIVIDLKSGAQPQKILNGLYKHSELETTFHFNMLGIVNGVPETLTLKSILEEFVKHRLDVVERRTKYELRKAEEREHILAGLKKALDHIDKIIKTIRAAKDVESAKVALMRDFKLTDKQSVAILEMKLQKLAGLERKKIEEELAEKRALIKELMDLLGSPKKILSAVTKEFREIREKYGDARRTKVVSGGVKEINVEDLVPEEETMLVLTRGGYVKRTRPEEYKKQKRGGVGVVDLNTKEEDFITILESASTHSDVLFFSDMGKVYQLKMYDIPEGKRATKGKALANFLSISSEERVTSVLVLPKGSSEDRDQSVMMVTKEGVAKRVAAAVFKDVRRSGIIAIKLGKGDELLSVSRVSKGETVILTTAKGQSIRFKDSDIREMGRSAGGVKAIRLDSNDSVVGAEVIQAEGEKDASLLVLTQNGYGKRTAIGEYKVQKRGGSGIKTAKVTDKTGRVVAACILCSEEGEIVAMSGKGQVIRIAVKEIPSLGRQTQGVRVMKPRAGDKLSSLSCL